MHFINIDASDSTHKSSKSKSSRITRFYPLYQVNYTSHACQRRLTDGNKTNTLISQIFHKSHNYNAHHSFLCSFLLIVWIIITSWIFGEVKELSLTRSEGCLYFKANWPAHASPLCSLSSRPAAVPRWKICHWRERISTTMSLHVCFALFSYERARRYDYAGSFTVVLIECLLNECLNGPNFMRPF